MEGGGTVRYGGQGTRHLLGTGHLSPCVATGLDSPPAVSPSASSCSRQQSGARDCTGTGRALRDMRRTLPSNRIHPGARAGKGLAGVRAELRSVGASLCWNQALLDRHIIGWLQMPREVSKIMWLKAGELLYVRHQESGQPCRG